MKGGREGEMMFFIKTVVHNRAGILKLLAASSVLSKQYLMCVCELIDLGSSKHLCYCCYIFNLILISSHLSVSPLLLIYSTLRYLLNRSLLFTVFLLPLSQDIV